MNEMNEIMILSHVSNPPETGFNLTLNTILSGTNHI